MLDSQQDVIDFLSEPSPYGAAVEPVDIIETHVSLVFLLGDRAYKLKRAVKYPYLNFSTAEHRRRACQAELALNRRTAPTLYLEVRALARTPDGRIGFATDGPAIDWLVVMRSFEQSSLFDDLAQTGGLSVPLVNELAGHIADFHAVAEGRFDYGGATALTAIAETNLRCLTAARHAEFAPERINQAASIALRQALRSFSRRSSSGCSARRRNATRSVTATDPWVGAKQTVGQRVIPLLRMNSATAASYSVWDISGSLSVSNTIELRGGSDPQSPAPLKSSLFLAEHHVSATQARRIASALGSKATTRPIRKAQPQRASAIV